MHPSSFDAPLHYDQSSHVLPWDYQTFVVRRTAPGPDDSAQDKQQHGPCGIQVDDDFEIRHNGESTRHQDNMTGDHNTLAYQDGRMLREP